MVTEKITQMYRDRIHCPNSYYLFYNTNRSETEGDQDKRVLGEEQAVANLPLPEEPKSKRGRRRKHIEQQQAELNAATYHLKLENQQQVQMRCCLDGSFNCCTDTRFS